MNFIKNTWRQIPAYIYLFSMFSIFLFYFDDYYFNITETRYNVFKICTIFLLVCYCMIGLFEIIYHILCKEKGWLKSTIKSFFHTLNLADIALILFVCIHILSMMLNADYRYEIWHGNAARYMGVEFYILILLVYLILSRVIEKVKPVILCFSLSVSLVSLLAILNFVGIDPFGFYTLLSARQIPVFLSTIGNINFLSSLICICFPITGFLYMSSPHKGDRIFYLINSIIAFICMVLSSSDSGFLGCGMFFYVSLLVVCKNYYRLRRWLLLLTTCLAGSKLVVSIVLLFPDGSHELDTTSRFLTTGLCSWILLFLCVIFLILLTIGKAQIKKWIAKLPLRAILIGFFLAAVLLFLGIVYYFTVVDPTYELGEFKNYLRFDMAWGTSRRYIWDRSLTAFHKFTFPQKIIGFGPGTLYFAVGTFLNDLTNNYDNAHSEYIQYLITVGITGLFTYCVFLYYSLRYAFQRMYRDNIYLIAFGLSFFVYIAQASINLNQIFTTPLFFLIAALLRQQTRCMDKLKEKYYLKQKNQDEREESDPASDERVIENDKSKRTHYYSYEEIIRN